MKKESAGNVISLKKNGKAVFQQDWEPGTPPDLDNPVFATIIRKNLF
jgi:hypothetical protein